MAYVEPHESPNDWCHVCGKRSDQHATITYPDDAEHADEGEHWRVRPGPGINKLRICAQCAKVVAKVASNPDGPKSRKRL